MDRPPSSVHRRILEYNTAARKLLFLAVACGFVAAVLVVAQAWLLSDAIARVFIGHESLDDVLPVLAAMLALAVARGLCVWGGDLLAQRSASRLKSTLRADLTQHLFALGPAYVRGERSGELVNATVQGVEDLDEYITLYQPLRYLAVLVPVFGALVVLTIDPLTVLIFLFTGPLLVLFLALIGSKARERTQRRFLEMSWLSASFLDLLQGLATLKMFGRSREQVDNIRELSRSYGTTTMGVLRTAFETALVLELGSTMATALVAVEVSVRLMSGDLAFERALAVLIITPEFFIPLRQLSTRYHAGTAGKSSAERIFTILDTPAQIATRPSPAPIAALPARLEIRVEGVSYAYDDGRRSALDDISLVIPHGGKVALVGPTGAGKSSVASLLLRFIEPDQGTITVDGVPLDTIDPAVWRSLVAWVPQRPHLFYGTVADNIRLARRGGSDDEIVTAARAANAHDFIQRLPLGYATPIGERGARLSGGEQQRLAIARAFFKDAPFLVLDEPASHLDAESEAALRDALRRLQRGRTVLIIAHRLDLAYDADQIVVLRQGRVVESGSHQTLLARGDDYRQMVASFERGRL